MLEKAELERDKSAYISSIHSPWFNWLKFEVLMSITSELWVRATVTRHAHKTNSTNAFIVWYYNLLFISEEAMKIQNNKKFQSNFVFYYGTTLLYEDHSNRAVLEFLKSTVALARDSAL